MKLRVYDDPASVALRPFTWVRPASRLMVGVERMQERWERLAAPHRAEVTLVTRALLAPIGRNRCAFSQVAPEVGDLWVSDLLVPEATSLASLRTLEPDQVARSQDRLIAFRLGTGMVAALGSAEQREAELSERLTRAAAAASRTIELPDARLLLGLADLLRHHEALIGPDLERLVGDLPPPALAPTAGYATEAIRLGGGCRIDHGAVLDAREGPVVLAEGCEVEPHTWIKGPFFAGPRSRLLGGKIGSGSAVGLQCRIRGEVEASVALGFVNKAHDGFLGHSYLGEWINLGALTTTSDLKNNYSYVRLELNGVEVPTGLKKVGSFLGDHVKTRIGCLLNTGTVVGLGANLFGDPAVAEKWVPDFAWGAVPGDRSTRWTSSSKRPKS
ncbi:MAG: hypothetical protein IPK72_12815 [Candidatus Eisenbacteria bacterium]|nr:hypothetical protein [Candidatus Eisenbacteria bacterium]